MKRAPGIFLLAVTWLLLLVPCAWGRSAGTAMPVPYTLADGTRLTGYLSLPPQYQKGQRYPAILLIHGGTGDQGGLRNRAREFSQIKPVRKHLCPNYVVFSAAYHADYLGGPKEIASMAVALQTMAALPQVDPGRIAALGVSHGGYLALMAAVQPRMPVKIKAVVSISGVTDVAAFLKDLYRLHPGGKADRERPLLGLIASPVIRALGWPPDKDAETKEKYRRLSVLTYLGNLQAPVLVIHGSKDNLVPVSQARSLREGLKKQEKTCEYLEVATGRIGGHFIILTKPEIWDKIDLFLKKYL
ncbi:MAG: alpha/beta fold hydrolase [Syntrophales bacterium]|nr:alpha/beta fold hydrolase [Syntrophales bacterium]MDD5643729.1 alpha/beta fold hydrolase [Syntrophales bacterium]